ncbi:hypothetical protein CDL15_Pgr013828 [Punica granatum]|uniref:Uncharacterized protein n=1 Tax=Punica granatum TaxID=22663 RepID=A0A218VX75_PUNGR|nr:hypothetical protein CDL15_Pgr013828 [Punica granatum]
MPLPCNEGFCFVGCRVMRDSSSGVERLRIPSGRKLESAVVLAVCSTCDPDITSKSLQNGSRSRRPRCEASRGSR